MSIKSIHFLCAVPRKFSAGGPYKLNHEPCEFKLGVGPCGRNVIELTCQQDSHFFAITQVSIPQNVMHCTSVDASHKEVKVFTYKLTDVLGRITTTLIGP